MNVIEYFCDKVAVMYLGRIMEMTSSAELSRSALHPYTRSLQASAPRLDIFKDAAGEASAPIYGETPNPRILIKGCPFAPRCPEALPVCTETLPELRETSPGHGVRCHGIDVLKI